jgi:hypothetical protein
VRPVIGLTRPADEDAEIDIELVALFGRPDLRMVFIGSLKPWADRAAGLLPQIGDEMIAELVPTLLLFLHLLVVGDNSSV